MEKNIKIKDSLAQVEKEIPLAEIEIKNNEDFERASNILKNVKSIIKNLDEKRKQATKPLDDSKKEIMSWFSPIVDKAKACESMLKSKMSEYLSRLEEEKKKMEQEAREKDVPVVIDNKPKVSGVKEIIRWKAKLKDVDAIPRAFLLKTPKQHEALMSVLNEIASSTRGAIEIPGVEFYEEKSISSTSAWDI